MSEKYQTREQRRKAATKNKTIKKPTKNVGQLIKKIFLIGISIGIIGMIVGAITFIVYAKDAPPLEESLLKDPLSSKIYDKDGNQFAELGAQKRTYLKYDEIPELVIDAVIATEDSRFEKHHGIDPIRLVGAVIANFKEGFGAEGASTITQQVVKNAYLSPKKTLDRKAEEAWMALQLERKFSKKEILEMYLNKILYGRNYYGVAKAAEVYLGLDKDELDQITLEQAALLAGIPQSPNRYNPFKHPESAEKRRNVVLSLMAQHGYITQEESKKAQAVPIEDTIAKPKEESQKYDAFIDQVLDEISELEGVDAQTGGLKIYTTLDPDAQEYVEEILANKESFPDNKNFQTGIALLDTRTGEIRAIGGGIDRVAGGWNYATDIRKQPGSTIKPILDYGPAIEKLKWSTHHQLKDEPYTYSDGTKINNWDNKYVGQQSMRYMLQESRNIPALKALQAVGLKDARNFAVGLGIPLEEQIYEPYAVGGFKNGVSPLQMAGAYSAFGNGGVFNKPHAVVKIEFPDKTVKDLAPEPKLAMSDYTAFMITDMLESVVDYGTGRAANVSGLNIAGKTGTTNYDKKTIQAHNLPRGAVPDIWFVGYTPEYTCAVWTGFEKVDENASLSYNDQKIAKALFKQIITNVSEGKNQTDFKKPSSVVRVGIEKGSDPAVLASEFTPKNEIVYEYFVKGTEPTEISKKYQKLLSPIDFNAQFDIPNDRLSLSWKNPNENMTDEENEEFQKSVAFEIKLSIDNGPFNILTTTKELQYIVDHPVHGAVYSFEMATIDAENPARRSESVQVKLEIPKEMDDFEDLPDSEDGNEDHINPDTDNPDGDLNLPDIISPGDNHSNEDKKKKKQDD